jgi:signal transduction histidine kinase
VLAPPQLHRAPANGDKSPRQRREDGLPRIIRPFLRVRLAGKLVGANLLLIVVVAWVMLARGSSEWPVAVATLGLAAGVVLNYVLVRVALRPLHELEAAADRVWRGDLGTRVAASPIADPEMARLGGTVNRLLDGLAGDRERMRELATAVVDAADAERARIGRELHDSTAQTLAAIGMQLAAAARDSRDPELAERLAMLREMAGAAVDEVRALAHSVHPRVLDDLGLVAALEWQARQLRERSAIEVRVHVSPAAARLVEAADRHATSALYRVAQESLRNAERHADAHAVDIVVSASRGPRDEELLGLDVTDDGVGFDVPEAEARRPGMGLFSMRERVGLVGGTFRITSVPGEGTRVTARVPAAPHGRHNYDGRPASEER